MDKVMTDYSPGDRIIPKHIKGDYLLKLYEHNGMSLEDIAAIWGVTKQRISQLLTVAREKRAAQKQP